MKRRILITIASITLISGVTAGALMSQPQEEVKQEAKVTTVDKSTEKPKEAPKEQEVVQSVTNTPPVSEPVVSEQQSTPEPAAVEPTPVPNYDMFGYVFRNIQPKLEGHSLGHRLGKVTATIIAKRDTRPELYTTEAIDGTIDTCLAYLKPLSGEELAIALLRGDCGI